MVLGCTGQGITGALFLFLFFFSLHLALRMATRNGIVDFYLIYAGETGLEGILSALRVWQYVLTVLLKEAMMVPF